MNLTPTRLATLRELDQRGKCLIACLPQIICPRVGGSGQTYKWRKQAAARMGGLLVAALKREGLVKVEHADCGVGFVSITDAGRALLAKHRSSDADELQAAIAAGLDETVK